MLGHRIILDKFKSTEFIQKTFSDYSGNKLELKNNKTPGEFSNILSKIQFYILHKSKNKSQRKFKIF